MGTEFLVACLWVVVLVYWFWTRLPARSDTVGVYRRALHVLEHTAPTRVVPAYRLSVPAIAPVDGPHPAVALCHKRAQVRRRRRDALAVLLGAVLVTLAAALVTKSSVALAAQVLCDLALASYVSLLVRTARPGVGAGTARRSAVVAPPLAFDAGRPPVFASQPAFGSQPAFASQTVFATSPPAFASSPAAAGPVRLRAQIREVLPKAPQTPSDDPYVPAHALRQADLHVVVRDADDYAEQSYGDDGFGDESYGDFDSYASLALATAR